MRFLRELNIPVDVTHLYSNIHLYLGPDANEEDEQPRAWDSLNLPDSVVYIGGQTFINFQFSNIKWSKNLKYIGKSAFEYMSFHGDLNLPDTIEFLGTNAFLEVPITKLNIPKNLKDTGTTIFGSNYNPQIIITLDELIIPSGIINIGMMLPTMFGYGIHVRKITLEVNNKLNNNLIYPITEIMKVK
jgi:hypothetical protein